MSMKGKIVVVSGGSRGLGRSLAVDFAAAGAFVYLTCETREEEGAATVEQIRSRGGDGACLRCDVRDRQRIAACVDKVIAERGGIDVLINNAAICRDAPFPLLTAEDWDEVLLVNLTGAASFCRAVSRPMISRGRGVILNVGSIAGLHASAGQSNYAASKGGLIAFTRTLAVELAPRGIRVNAIVPGMIETGMARRLDRGVADARREAIPLKRFGTPGEVSAVARFLASDEASYVIGQAIVVDGGLSS